MFHPSPNCKRRVLFVLNGIVGSTSRMPRSLQVRSQMLEAAPLTSLAFKDFGFVIEDPPKHLNNFGIPEPVEANQGTSLKYSDISSLVNAYSLSSASESAKPSINLFVCAPRSLLPDNGNSSGALFPLSIMERHPYTTQTFAPLGLASTDQDTAYVVVVSCTSSDHSGQALPDTDNIKAFIAKGSQAVTYGVGIWHAPMIVIGGKPVPFMVTQFANGVPDDDCQEVEFSADGPGIMIQVPKLGLQQAAKL